MELRCDAILYCNLGNKNSDAGHNKCSRGPQVPHPCIKAWRMSTATCNMFSQWKIDIPVAAVKLFDKTRNSALVQHTVTHFKTRDNNLFLHQSKQGPRRPLFSGNIHLSFDRRANIGATDSV